MPSRLRSRHEYLEQRLEPGVLADERGQCRRPDPRAAAGRVGDHHQIEPACRQRPGRLDDRRGVVAARRHHLHAGHEAAGGQRRAQRRLLRGRHRRPGVRRLDSNRRRDRQRRLHVGRQLLDRQGDLPDVLRRRAAAATHHPHAAGDEAPGVGGHVLGRAEVDVAALDVAGLAGVGLRRERHVAHRRQPFHGLEHRRRADTAVHADHVGAARGQGRPELLGRRAVEAVAVFLGRHQRDDRQRARRAGGLDRGGGLVPVAERLENQQVHATLDQGRGLLAEVLAGLVDAGLAPGLDAHAQRADGPGHVGGVAGHLARQPGARPVDLAHLVAEPEPAQLHPRGPEGVGLEDVGAGGEVLAVHADHQLGL